MGVIKEAMIGAIDLVDHTKGSNITWTLDKDPGQSELNIFAHCLMTNYPDEFEILAENTYDGYDAKSLEFLSNVSGKTYCFDYFKTNEKTFCELYEIKNLPNEAYLEL